jgi:hypothetical protein
MLRRTTIQGVFAHLPEAKPERDFRPKPPSPSQTGILRHDKSAKLKPDE